MKRIVFVVASMVLALPMTLATASTPWYAGVSGGVSSLRPETDTSSFKIDASLSFGGGVFIGYYFSPRFSFEAAYNDLGSATLGSANGKQDIGYRALSAGTLMYLFGDSTDIAERNGFSGYFRLGLSSINNRASIPLEQEDNVAVWAGAGVEWPLSRNLNLRAELASFDGDAQAAHLSVLFRPRPSVQSTTVLRTPAAPTQSDATSTVQEAVPAQPEVAPAPNSTVEPATQSAVQPSIPIDNSSCVAPTAREPIDARGCALFGGILTGVDFASGTANLTLSGANRLDQLSDNLLRYTSIVIEIQAHTESFGNEKTANEIAKQRTITVARHLTDRGVPVSRLKARAFGHSRPLAPDNTNVGRQQNNRIELLVLE